MGTISITTYACDGPIQAFLKSPTLVPTAKVCTLPNSAVYPSLNSDYANKCGWQLLRRGCISVGVSINSWLGCLVTTCVIDRLAGDRPSALVLLCSYN